MGARARTFMSTSGRLLLRGRRAGSECLELTVKRAHKSQDLRQTCFTTTLPLQDATESAQTPSNAFFLSFVGPYFCCPQSRPVLFFVCCFLLCMVAPMSILASTRIKSRLSVHEKRCVSSRFPYMVYQLLGRFYLPGMSPWGFSPNLQSLLNIYFFVTRAVSAQAWGQFSFVFF